MKWPWKLLKLALSLGIVGTFVAALALGAIYYYLEPGLPEIDNLRDVRLQVPLKVYSRDGKLVAEFGEQRRNPLDYDELPERMIQAFLSAEDASFFDHQGVDLSSLLRAGIQLALTGEKKQGGSTVTMQVARNFYLTPKKTYTRKLSEIFLALRIERQLSKQEILELYLNKIYLGHRSYGVSAAARVYYGKTVQELDIAQTAMIAGLPKAPSSFNPIANPPRAIKRRNYVLDRMHALGHISEVQYEEAVAQPITASRYAPEMQLEAPYVAEMVRADLVERFGPEAYSGGFRVYTTILAAQQEAANQALRTALDAYTERHGYFGAEDKLDPVPSEQPALDAALADRPSVGELRPAVVTAIDQQSATIYLGRGKTGSIGWDQMKWARPHISTDRLGPNPKQVTDVLGIGDIVRVKTVAVDDDYRWRLAQIPRAAAALVALDPSDGAISALVGGYDFYYSKFNRVTQAKRQPGSGFKAFIYSAALENGFTPGSLINDAPVVFEDPSLEGAWRPENYSGKFFGPTRLREALTKSRNLVSIRLLRSMGIEAALQHIARFGFRPEELPHNLSLALGSADVTPLQMANAYAVLSNGGYQVTPYFIERIEQDGVGTVYEADPLVACVDCPPLQRNSAGDIRFAPRVLEARNRYLMYSMLQDVIRRGTATKARELSRKDLAGKTGTTNDQRDAWFNGFNQHLVANVWVGFDDNSKLGRGEVGGRAALPAWISFMRAALASVPDSEPQMPPDLVSVRIDPRTGIRATAATENAIFEVFRKENVPGSGTTVASGGESGGYAIPAAVAPPAQDLF